MDLRKEILDIPRALRETLAKGRPEYESIIRGTRWGEGPLYWLGSGPCAGVGLTGVYAFESLLGWPAIVRSPEEFRIYGLSTLRPRSVVLAVSLAAREDEMVEVLRAARLRSATVLALTADSSHEVAKASDGVFLVRGSEEEESGLKKLVCGHVASSALAVIAARTLRKPRPQLGALEEEIQALPAKIESASTHLADALKALARELAGLPAVCAVGAGRYRPIAREAAFLFRALAGLRAEGFAAEEFSARPERMLGQDAGVLFISGSRCGMKRRIHQLASDAKTRGARIFALTDRNDRELAARAGLALFLPEMSELAGSALALSVLESLAYQAGQEKGCLPKALKYILARGERPSPSNRDGR